MRRLGRLQVVALVLTLVIVGVLFSGWLTGGRGIPRILSIGQPPASSENGPVAVVSPVPVPSPVSVPLVSALPTVSPTPASTPSSSSDASVRQQPNELGVVPIIEYHIISDENGRWTRSRDTFRQDLERWYEAGFRTISLHDFIDNRIDVPAGLSPLIITFDDSSPGQFTFIEEGGSLKPDPNCAVAILEEFVREHPDFGLHATFFVLPAADPPHDLFGQKEYQKQKLEYIVNRGMEIGNHTFWHQQLTDLPDEEVVRQIGQANKVVTEMVPGYRVRTFALPLGEWPPNRSLVVSGEWEGVPYKNDAVLLAGAQPAPPPSSTDYDPLAIPRIQVIDETMALWFDLLQTDPEMWYVSDGNPETITFPERLSSKLNAAMIDGEKVVTY